MKLEIIEEIDTREYQWCDSAVLVDIKGGKGTLKTVTSKEFDYDYYSLFHIMLNGKPIVQSNRPSCPTCSGMLARGYGIEKTDTPELIKIRNKINSPFVDMQTGIESIKPVLGLLEDGYYVIADARLYPTAGGDNFFMNVPDKLTYMKASALDYYNHDYLTVSECFPAYLYPTQSNDCLNPERARYYLDMIEKENAPRAIAFYHYGFMCALLDGHHKAYAAAMRGTQLRTLTIIPATGYGAKPTEDHKMWKEDKIYFADIVIPLDEKVQFRPFQSLISDKMSVMEFSNSFVSEQNLILECYPDIDELTGFFLSELGDIDLTADIVNEWLISGSEVDKNRLKYALGYYAKTDLPKAMIIAAEIIRSDNSEWYLRETAMRFIVRHKSDEAEQLAIEYIINHEPDDPVYKIADGYWSNY